MNLDSKFRLCKCIKIKKDNYGDKSYILRDIFTKEEMCVDKQGLVYDIEENIISVMNIRMTNSGYNSDVYLNVDPMNKIEQMLYNAKALGILTELKGIFGKPYYIMKSGINSILYIPDSTDRVSNHDFKLQLYINPEGTLKIVGGTGVFWCTKMFDEVKVREIDFSMFDSSNVEDITGMFENCVTEKMDLTKLRISNLKSASYAFYNCETKELDLSNIKLTDRIETLTGTFMGCRAEKINIPTLYFSDLGEKEIYNMFKWCDSLVCFADKVVDFERYWKIREGAK